jgi:hypothetical protein
VKHQDIVQHQERLSQVPARAGKFTALAFAEPAEVKSDGGPAAGLADQARDVLIDRAAPNADDSISTARLRPKRGDGTYRAIGEWF